MITFTILRESQRPLPAVLLAALTLVLPHLALAAKWLQADSKLFSVVSDLPEPEVRQMVEDLHAFRHVLERARPDTTTDAAPERQPPMRIYAFARSKDAGAVLGKAGRTGMYHAGSNGAISVIWHPKRSRWNANGRRFLMHEYTHHHLRSNAAYRFPSWLDEGIAEYFSTFETDGEYAIIGKAPVTRLWLLDRFEWMSGRQLVVEGPSVSSNREPLRESAEKTRTSHPSLMRYAQGWLAVHWLFESSERLAGISHYLRALNEGMDAETAFTDAFGMTPDALGAMLRDVWAEGEVSWGRMKLGTLPDVAIEVTRLAGDRRFWVSEAQLRSGELGDPARMRAAFEKLLTRDGVATEIGVRALTNLIELENEVGVPEGTASAVAGVPDEIDNPRLLAELGRRYLGVIRYQYQGGDTTVADERMRYLRAEVASWLEHFPDHPHLLSLYVSTHIEDGDVDARDALYRLGHLQSVYPQHQDVQYFGAWLYAELGMHQRAMHSLEFERRFARADSSLEHIARSEAALRAHEAASVQGVVPVRAFVSRL